MAYLLLVLGLILLAYMLIGEVSISSGQTRYHLGLTRGLSGFFGVLLLVAGFAVDIPGFISPSILPAEVTSLPEQVVPTTVAPSVATKIPATIVGIETAINTPIAIPPTPVPNVEDEETFRIQIQKVFKVITTYRVTGITQGVRLENPIVGSQSESEYVEPDKYHEIIRYDNGSVAETIAISTQAYYRSNSKAWAPSKGWGSGWIEEWNRVINAQPITDGIVTDHGSQLDRIDGTLCRLYYVTTLFDHGNSQNEVSNEICFDQVTYYPVGGIIINKEIKDGKVIETDTSKFRYYDFNASIEIVPPIP